jgi:hypothetical protein
MPWTRPPEHRQVHEVIDKAAVAELVQTERAARDQGQWERMAACYGPHSIVAISWITSSGPEFVEASKAAFAAGVRHIHQLSPTLVTLGEDKALAETGCVILLPGVIDGVEVTVACQARLHARCVRVGDEWRLEALTGAYYGDALTVRGAGPPPELDPARLASYRAPYRYMAYLLAESGKTARDDLPAPDRPELLQSLWSAEAAWLAKA